jgi:hypothetical protein
VFDHLKYLRVKPIFQASATKLRRYPQISDLADLFQPKHFSFFSLPGLGENFSLLSFIFSHLTTELQLPQQSTLFG